MLKKHRTDLAPEWGGSQESESGNLKQKAHNDNHIKRRAVRDGNLHPEHRLQGWATGAVENRTHALSRDPRGRGSLFSQQNGGLTSVFSLNKLL